MGRGFMLVCHAHQGAYHTPSHNTGRTGHAGHVIMAAENLKKVKILVLGNTGTAWNKNEELLYYFSLSVCVFLTISQVLGRLV